LGGVQNVSLVTLGDSTTIVITANGSSLLQFNNLNQTFGPDYTINSGTFSFDGNTVEMNDCTGQDGLSTEAIIGIVIGSLAIFAIAFYCLYYFVFKRKTFNKKKMNVDTSEAFPSYDPNRQYQTYGQSSPAATVLNPNGHNEVLPPFHNINNATDESLHRSNMFMEKYPPGSPQALDAARQTANIPPSMYNSPIKISMMEPRIFADFGFYEPSPVVYMSTLEPTKGTQRITFYTSQDCSIQSNVPLLPHRLSSYGQVDECFYKVKIIRKKRFDSTMAIGFATCPYPPFRLPGWDPQSVGYHSDDGAVFLNDVDFGTPCGPALHEGDTLGIGYRVVQTHMGYSTTFYFTHNGSKLPTELQSHEFHPSMLYPTIGTDGDCEVECIFGNVQEMFFPV
jgi:hypothetical protein